LYKEDSKDIERGAKRVGRTIDEIDVAVRAFTAVSEDYDDAKSAVEWRSKRALVLERRALKRLGYEISVPSELSIQRSLPSREVQSKIYSIAERIPMDAVDAISIFGRTEDCIRKIEEFLKVNAKHIIVDNVGPNIDETLRHYGEEIIPFFKENQK
jgi:phthiodiolone/phenolphthiodiolone dimycocerosates ketoreductase